MTVVYQSSFEEGFYNYQDDGHMHVPNGWIPKWDANYGPRPEWSAKDASLGQTEVRSGRFAANFFHVYARWHGELYRKFNVTPGALVTVSVWCMGKHAGTGGAGMVLGVDVDGGNDYSLSDWWSTYMAAYKDGAWVQLTQDVVAGSTGEITVALIGRTDDPIEHWGVHWDDVVIETNEPTPDPENEDGLEATLMYHINALQEELNELKQDVLAISAKAILCVPV